MWKQTVENHALKNGKTERRKGGNRREKSGTRRSSECTLILKTRTIGTSSSAFGATKATLTRRSLCHGSHALKPLVSQLTSTRTAASELTRLCFSWQATLYTSFYGDDVSISVLETTASPGDAALHKPQTLGRELPNRRGVSEQFLLRTLGVR